MIKIPVYSQVFKPFLARKLLNTTTKPHPWILIASDWQYTVNALHIIKTWFTNTRSANVRGRSHWNTRAQLISHSYFQKLLLITFIFICLVSSKIISFSAKQTKTTAGELWILKGLRLMRLRPQALAVKNSSYMISMHHISVKF